MAKRASKNPIDGERLIVALKKRGYFNKLPAGTVAAIQARIRHCAAERFDPRRGVLAVEAVADPGQERGFTGGPEPVQAWLAALAAALDLQPRIALERWSDDAVAFAIDGKAYGVGEGFPSLPSGIVGRSKNPALNEALAATEGVFNHWANSRASWVGCAAVGAAGTFGFALDPVGEGDLCLLNTLADDLPLEQRWQSLLDWQFIYQDD